MNPSVVSLRHLTSIITSRHTLVLPRHVIASQEGSLTLVFPRHGGVIAYQLPNGKQHTVVPSLPLGELLKLLGEDKAASHKALKRASNTLLKPASNPLSVTNEDLVLASTPYGLAMSRVLSPDYVAIYWYINPKTPFGSKVLTLHRSSTGFGGLDYLRQKICNNEIRCEFINL